MIKLLDNVQCCLWDFSSNNIDETTSVTSAQLYIVWVQTWMALVQILLDTTPDLPFKDLINICLIDKSVHIRDRF